MGCGKERARERKKPIIRVTTVEQPYVAEGERDETRRDETRGGGEGQSNRVKFHRLLQFVGWLVGCAVVVTVAVAVVFQAFDLTGGTTKQKK